jgi:hypothetical protein
MADNSGRAYAAHAGRQMVRSMGLTQEDLIDARMYYEQKLRKGYLVQKQYVSYAFTVAVRFSERKHKHGETQESQAYRD